MVSASRWYHEGVMSVGSAMVSCVAMVPEISLGVRSVGGLRTVIGYIYMLSEVLKPRGTDVFAFQCSSYGRYNSSE